MSLPDRFEDRLAIERLNQDFCHELDRGAPEGFAALFTEDALYTNGPRRSEGRTDILAFARGRTADGARTSRHIATGLRISFEAPDRATGVSCGLAYSASGQPPLPLTSPSLLADFHDVYRREEAGWLFAERRIVAIFVRPTLTTDS